MAKNNIWTKPRADGGWENGREGSSRASSVHKTKAEAVKAGRQMAINSNVEHIIQNMNGRIGEKNSYGNDPCPPRDKK